MKHCNVKSIKLLLATFFIFLSVTANSQQTEIKVLDSEDLSPIPYAHICTENKNTGSKTYQATDINGKFQINIKAKIIISISYIGCETVIDTISPNTFKKEYKLKRTGFDIDEVVVTGQYKPIAVDKSIYEVKLIGKTQIENKAANNLADLLSDELNISLSHDPSTGTSMKLQGISGENIKILIDGVPVIGRLAGNIDISQIDLSNVDHVEIIEGPMSVIYGSNALAGVINVITKDNKYAKFKAGLNTCYETIGTYNANANISLKKKKHLVKFNCGRNFFTGFDTDTSTRRMQYKPKEQYNTGLNYSFNATKFKIKYKVNFFKESLLDRSNLISTPYSIKGFDTWFYTLRANNNIQINHRLTKRSAYDLLAAYSYYDRKRYRYQKDMTNLETQLTSTVSDHDTTKFDAVIARGTYNYASENNKINIQAGFDFNLEYGTGKRMKNSKEDIKDYAIFTGLKWNITHDFAIQPGLRASHNTKYNSPVVPSFNLKYNLKDIGIRASYARGFRAPSLKELYLYFYDSNHQIEGNENLEAEYSHNYNLSTSYKTGTKKNKFEFSIKTYYNIIENMISLVQVDPDNELHYTNKNIGHFKSLGGEAGIQYKYLPYLKIDAGYARMGRMDSYDDNVFIFSNSFNSKLTYNILKINAGISVFYKYIGKYPFYTYWDELQLNYMDAYHNLDITASKKFFHNKIIISGGAKNIFNNIEIQGTQEGSGGTHGSNSGVSSLAGWGRTYFISLKINITKY